MGDLSFVVNERENSLTEFYKASGILVNYLCAKEKLFKRTEEYYRLKGAGEYPVNLKDIGRIYCRILEWTNLLSLKDDLVRDALEIVFDTIKNNVGNPTPEEYISKYLTTYTMSTAVGLM